MTTALKVLLSSETCEWYTPPLYIEAARIVLGGFDLDPASNPTANTWIKASKLFTIEDNGLARSWYGRVFLNPPYGKICGQSSQGLWARKLISEYRAGNVTAAILLVNFVPGYKWFSPLFHYPICAVDHCIEFVRPDGTQAGKAKASSAFVYLGQDANKFARTFSEFGPVAKFQRYS
jgi:ParB family chromosome partitioning protein